MSSGVLFTPGDLCVTLAVSSLSQQTHMPTPSGKCHLHLSTPRFALGSGITLSCVYFVFSFTRGVCFFHGSWYSSSSSPPRQTHPTLPPVFPVLSLPIASPSMGRMCGGHELALHLWVFSAQPTLGIFGRGEAWPLFLWFCASLSIPSVLPLQTSSSWQNLIP